MRVILAALIGGVAIFCWGAAVHMLPSHEMTGIKSLPSDRVLLPQMKQLIPDPGFYFFPGMDETDTSEQAQKEWMERLQQGPTGILVFRPEGGEAMSMAQLGREYGSNTISALIIAIVLSQVRGGRAKRGMIGGLLGVLAWMMVDVSYWNWYGFPDAMMLASLVEQGGGGLLGGLGIALVLGRDRAMAVAASARSHE